MGSARFSRPSPAMVVALVALFVALTGSAVAVDRAGKKLPANSVGTKQLKEGAVTPPDIKRGAITSPALAANAVTPPALASGAVTAPAIANEAVGSTALAPQSVIPGKIQPGAVTNEKLAPNSVTTATLQPGAITESRFSQTLPRVGVSLATPYPVDTDLGAGSPPTYVGTGTADFSTEAYDTRSMHVTTGAARQNLVAPVDGLYKVTMNAVWANAGGSARAALLIHTKVSCGFCESTAAQQIGPPAADDLTSQSISATVAMQAGDRIFPRFGSIGATTTVNAADVSMEWIGPPTS